ncbi:Uncharacterized protein ChrSV_4825 [Chromobacterium vaccinii]|nr:Uncharacterized protein ChrSV_4825 [Chromobacterium vaccinii]
MQTNHAFVIADANQFHRFYNYKKVKFFSPPGMFLFVTNAVMTNKMMNYQ